MKKNIIPIVVLVIVVVACVLWSFLNMKQPAKYTGPVLKINLGSVSSLRASAVWIAENQGYFQEQGLDVDIKEFDSGKSALEEMLTKRDLDLVTVSQTPIMLQSFNRNDFAIVSGMAYSGRDVKILARRDKGIQKLSDLAGKNIGTTVGSMGYFVLGLSLNLQGRDLRDVHITDMKATELAQALADGRVDAIATWEPNIAHARQLLGERTILLHDDSAYRESFFFVGKNDYIKGHREALERFLRAIDTANAFMVSHKDAAIEIVARRMQYDKNIIAPLWEDFHFTLFLDQSIYVDLEEEARWAIREGLLGGGEHTVPNYLPYIHGDILRTVKPEAMEIFQ